MIFLYIFYIVFSHSFLIASVEHKDEFLDSYLSNISGNMNEKTQLLEHILKYPQGQYMDIGTGGDSIAIIAEKLPKDSLITLIAADIDPSVVESIKKRRPEILSYINNSKGPEVKLMTMSATDMKQIEDCSLQGVGASALAHEIYSYVPNKSSLDQFISEACRVLKKEGVLVYRDPKWVNDPKNRVLLKIESEIAKYYTVLFLTKFLDREHSQIKDFKGECCKPLNYLLNDIKVTVFVKSLDEYTQFSFHELINLSTKNIDFNRNFTIDAPKGLIAEIHRHYLMYLRDQFPIGLIDRLDVNADLDLSLICADIRSAVISFATRKNILIKNNVIDSIELKKFFHELIVLRDLFQRGLIISTQENSEVFNNLKWLYFKEQNTRLIDFSSKNQVLIDVKIIPLLFQGLAKGIFNFINPDFVPLDLLEHLKLEGEEHYFYKTTDELITYIGRYSKFILKETIKNGYCLAPIDPDHIRTSNRILYHRILKRDFSVFDQFGYPVEPVTDKNIIHFQLMPCKKAFSIYKKIINTNPQSYPELKRWYSIGEHELLDVVDQNDNIMGNMTRSEIYAKNLRNFRVINAFLMNSKGEIWIPTRHASKSIFPLALDCSIGGHVQSDESYYSAFCRETLEEINLDPKLHPHSLLKKLSPHEHGTSAFMEVYLIKFDGEVKFNKEDFSEGKWLEIKELKKMLNQGVFAKHDLKIIINECFEND